MTRYDAEQIARLHGHELRRWRTLNEPFSGIVAEAECKWCKSVAYEMENVGGTYISLRLVSRRCRGWWRRWLWLPRTPEEVA